MTVTFNGITIDDRTGKTKDELIAEILHRAHQLSASYRPQSNREAPRLFKQAFLYEDDESTTSFRRAVRSRGRRTL